MQFSVKEPHGQKYSLRVILTITFETQGRRHQKSKIGVPMAPRKGLISSKNLKKENIAFYLLVVLNFNFWGKNCTQMKLAYVMHIAKT